MYGPMEGRISSEHRRANSSMVPRRVKVLSVQPNRPAFFETDSRDGMALRDLHFPLSDWVAIQDPSGDL